MDEKWNMCSKYKTINNVTIKYKHLILRLENMIDEWHGSLAFSKINLKSDFDHILKKVVSKKVKTKFEFYEC